MAQVIRTPDEIERVRVEAQKLTFKADERGIHDEGAEVAYGICQWLFGYDDSDPVEMYLESIEDGE